MKTIYKIMTASIMSNFLMTSGFADDEAINRMVDANKYIQHFDDTITQVKKTSPIHVEYPALIPKPATAKKFFASSDEKSPQYGFAYMINIDSTPDCHGVKYCNVGMITARQTEKVEMMKNRKNKIITVPVMLADGINAYFTPGHAMGDYFPSTIQWIDDKVLYTISWNDGKRSEADLRDYLVVMASSAKHPGSG